MRLMSCAAALLLLSPRVPATAQPLTRCVSKVLSGRR